MIRARPTRWALRRRGPEVLLVDDGVPGGIQRALEYLEDEWAAWPQPPASRRVTLRGTGSLARAGPVFAGALAGMAWRLSTGRVRLVHVNVTQRGSTARALAVVALARAAGVPVLLHLHSSEYEQFVERLPPPLLPAVRWMFRAAGRAVVLGEGWAAYVHEALAVPRERLVVLPNAVPGPASLEARPPDANRVRMLFLGRLGERKGVPELLEALAGPALAGLAWEATLAGDGEVERFRRQAEALGLAGRVRFTGWVDAVEVRRLLAAAHVFVLPSRAEGLPLSVLEAMAHGLAVVATPVGAIGEVVEDGATGLLVPPGDSAALAGALHRLLGDEALRARLSTAARAAWERDHTLPAYARRVAGLYDELAPLT